jgi:cytochrome c551/c552
MTRLILALLALTALAGTASATPAFAQKEKKACIFCHTTPRGGSKFLNDAGKWYRVKKTLVGYKAPGKPAPKKPTPAPKKPTPAPKKK